MSGLVREVDRERCSVRCEDHNNREQMDLLDDAGCAGCLPRAIDWQG